jgi:type I restriction enzyme R subunit
MPLPYTGQHGEENFEQDFVQLLTTAGWEPEVLRGYTVDELIENWKKIVLDRNRVALNGIPLSDSETYQLLDVLKQQANTPVKANLFLNSAERGVVFKRDKDSADTAHAGKEVYVNLFDSREIAGGTSRYQIAEQTIFLTGDNYPDRRGDITLLIDGLPVIHIELKASGVDVFEGCTQIKKYMQEGIFSGFMGLIQVFWAITPEDSLYFANPGSPNRFNPSFFFRWGDRDNHVVSGWRELITGENHVLSIPEAHKMVGYYAVADKQLNTLKVCRSYQYVAIKEIVKRTARQKWGDHDQKGGFCWCTTGGGKTLSSYKAGQLIIDMNLADKVVFVVDRKALDEQSLKAYNSFSRSGESVQGTTSTLNLFSMLQSNMAEDKMIMTSIQKLSNINEDAEHIEKSTLDAIAQKRIVFIIDEAHRSQFGVMHQVVKNTFYNALFFGFTGTPIMKQNMKDGEQTTESVFGPCLAIYSLAAGIRDGNVLGFWPEYVSLFNEYKTREAVALHEAKVMDVSDIEPDSDEFRIYKYYMEKAPMAGELDDDGRLVTKGIEDFLSDADYNTDEHRKTVVEHIKSRWNVIANGEHGTLFHAILATTSIKEAYQYWKLFQEEAPELHVTALFDPNVNTNQSGVVDKEQWLIDIVEQYNKDFHTKYNRKTDPHYTGFKSDLISRLSHKQPYEHIGNDHDKCLDLVIVVDQLLTGFDSQYVNILYLDKTLELDGLIQAISRTNRIYNSDEKPWGMVKFYRKPETMKRNLDRALKLYCQGDEGGVKEKELEENIELLNSLYADICKVFAHDGIKNFVKLPSSDADRQKFRKDFTQMKATLRAAILQGFKWSGQYAEELDFDEATYRVLRMRFAELPSVTPAGPGPSPRPGFGLDIDLSTIRGEHIDANYLESRFKILTISDVERARYEESNDEIIKDIKDHLGALPAVLQKYAIQVLDDVQAGKLHAVPGKKLMEYIREYRDKAIRDAIHEEAGKFGVDEESMYQLYLETGSGEIDEIRLKALEETADIELVKEHFGCSEFAARGKLHRELKEYLVEQKAENE